MSNDPSKPVDLVKTVQPDIQPVDTFDSDDSVLNEIADALRDMQEASDKESEIQAKRHCQILWLTVAVLAVTVISVILQLR